MYTAAKLRGTRRYDGLLHYWGQLVAAGHAPESAHLRDDKPRLAIHFGPSDPVRLWYLDLWRAFRALNNTPPTTDLGWYRATGQFSRQQTVLWLYYVDGLYLAEAALLDQLTPEDRDQYIADLESARPYRVRYADAGDCAVADRLALSPRTVQADRQGAIRFMADFLTPPGQKVDVA